MTAHRWRNSAGHLIRVDGHHVLCETCPCEVCPEGSALYKIKYAEQDTSCTSGAANEYRLNISCECKCLFTGTIPDPLPEGKTAADYYNSYPLSGGTSPPWKRTIAGGPFETEALCDAFQVDGCAGTCSWFKIRTAYYDADCPAVNGGYNDDTSCECRCLITGTVPNPLPEGKTAEDYAGSYPITVTGEYKKELFGPYSATCALTADQVCAAEEVEGCDYGWGCSPTGWWYSYTSSLYGGYNCSNPIISTDPGCRCYTAAQLTCTSGIGCPKFGMGCVNGVENILTGGPYARECDCG